MPTFTSLSNGYYKKIKKINNKQNDDTIKGIRRVEIVSVIAIAK